MLGARLAEQLGRAVVVETRAGADGRIAAQAVASASPDGHTLLVTPTSTAIDIAFDPDVRPNVLRDLAPVAPLLRTDSVLIVHPKLPVDSVAALVSHARAHPGALNFSTPGARSSPRLVTELFKLRTGIDIVHVPYKGAVPQIASVISGDTQLSFAPLPAALPHIRAGKVRALGVASPARTALLPEVPTMKEAGVEGVEGSIWYAVFAPAATPAAIVDRLSAAIAKVAAEPGYREAMAAHGAEVLAMPPRELRAMLEAEVVKWRAVIVAANVKVDQ